MKLIKLIFALAISCGLILAAYYLIWNFMANKNLESIVTTLQKSEDFKVDYKSADIKGYPDNINIAVKDVVVSSKDKNYNLKYELKEILFSIYPFVLEEQAEIKLPKSHLFSLKINGKNKNFKLETSNINVRFLDKTINFDFSDVKLYDTQNNRLLLVADKLYYTGYLEHKNLMKINVSNLTIKGKTVNSMLINLDLENINQLDLIASFINFLELKNIDFNAYVNRTIKHFYDKDASINLTNMKWVDDSVWFELSTKLNLDARLRLNGPVEIVSNDLNTAQQLLILLTNNEEIDLSSLTLIKRLRSKTQNELIRISAKMDRGALQVFNEKVARVKSMKKD